MRAFVLALGLLGSLPAPALTYEGIVETIRREKVTTLEALLPKLPKDFLSEYALVHTSGSRQAATHSHPRVIVYGTDASLTCTFNGGGNVKGGDTLECLQYVPTERRFDFREIQFPTPENGLERVAFSDSGKSADGKTSCTRCHGADPRPNWAAYPKWPGTYGEDDAKWDDHEESRYYTFASNTRPTNARYLALEVPGNYRDFRHTSANLRIGDLFARMNVMRITRLAEAKLTEWERLALAIAGLDCSFYAEQRAALEKLDPKYREKFAAKELFAKLKISVHDWTMRPDDSIDTSASRNFFEHQTGYGMQMTTYAMGQIGELAANGAKPFDTLWPKLWATHEKASAYQARQHVALETLAKYVRVIDFYDDDFGPAQAQLCPALIELATQRYPKGATPL
jgi:hypothetical protein